MAKCSVVYSLSLKETNMMGAEITFHRLALATGLALALAACNGNASPQDMKAMEKTPVEAQSAAQAEAQSKMSAKDQIDFAIEDLAARLGISQDAIKVPSATMVTWRSGALGCPEPGMSYTQALVPGVRIMLWVDSVGYRYHAKTGKQPFYCPSDRAELPAQDPGSK
jgi:hypothetical protein